MFKFLVLILFLFNNPLSFSDEKTNFAERNLQKNLKKEKKKEIKNLLDAAVQDSEEEASEQENEEPLTLLEGVNKSEKTKNLIQRELARDYNFELGTPVNKATKTDEEKKAISFGDVELQISERPEELLVKKASPNNKNETLKIKAKQKREIGSQK